MSSTRRAELTVILDVAGEFVESPQSSRYPWVLRVAIMEIHYVWDPAVGYWRILSSVAQGTSERGRAPSSYSWTFGQHDKPLWVAALEHEHYPREIWKPSRHDERLNS